MTLVLKFEEKDFDTLRSFEASVRRQLGKNVYVGSDSLCFYFDYPPELCALLRPFSGNSYYEKDKVVDEKRKAKLEDLWKQLETTQLEFKFESSLPGAK